MKHRLLYTLALLFATLQTFAQTTYTYDVDNRLTNVVYKENGKEITVTYTYDKLGNRITKKVVNVSGTATESYTITVAVTPQGSGSVDGDGTYPKGSTVELHAYANTGYEFVKWTDGSTDNPRTITVTGNKKYTAQFKEVTVSPDQPGPGPSDPDPGNDEINRQNLAALVQAYLSNTPATQTTDIDGDGILSIADITRFVSNMNSQQGGGNNNSNTYEGHEYVDLGLPSGTLWATCNIGASAPEEAGLFYAWGETTGYTSDTSDGRKFNWASYRWMNQGVTQFKGINKYQVDDNQTDGCWYDINGMFIGDGKTTLDLADDAARTNWGGQWKMPTHEDVLELLNNTTHEWTTKNGKQGQLFTSTVNGNTLFLPASGNRRNASYYDQGSAYYRTSSLTPTNTTNAYTLYISEDAAKINDPSRSYGFSIRPIVNKRTTGGGSSPSTNNYNNHEYVDLGLPSKTLWATCNVGATTPEDTGCYFAWAEVDGSCDGKNDFSFGNYRYDNGQLGNQLTKYCDDSEYGYNGYNDNLTVLEPQDDAATNKWGTGWRTPTRTEVNELKNKNYTTWTLTTRNGVTGYVVTSKISGYTDKSIFLPAVGGIWTGRSLDDYDYGGFYWTSSLYWNVCEMGHSFVLRASGSTGGGQYERCRGLIVRPVISSSILNK